MLAALGTEERDVYVFDLKLRPDLMLEGLLWRLLSAPEVTKVMHDCRQASALLQHDYKVILRNVFDTQVSLYYMRQ